MYYINKAFRIFGYFLEAIKYIVLYPIARMSYRNRRIHLFAERGMDARDNAYHLYRFYRQNHPDIEAYYVITNDSTDREKVRKLGDVVKHRSLKHYLLFIAAEYKISTHIMGCSPNMDFYARFADRLHLPIKGNRIFLQHGVSKDNLPQLYKSRTNLDLFVCGAKPEYDFVSETFGYMDGEVQYTGLARYDALHNIQRKGQILCMPTWRKYLKYDPDVPIRQSAYVIKWNNLLNNQRLVSALRENSLKLVFYPHHEMQKHIALFQSDNPEVVIASFKDYDVQQLLKESQLLITDYSSVFFDFAYMEKPVVYYQFDKERFFSDHYAKGYFDYETMGFGEVSEQEDEIVEAVLFYIKNQFEMKSDYRSRITHFFPLHDRQNCQRIFEQIENL